MSCRTSLTLVVIALSAIACTTAQSQRVGQSSRVQFGTVRSAQEVTLDSNAAQGALVGGMVFGLARRSQRRVPPITPAGAAHVACANGMGERRAHRPRRGTAPRSMRTCASGLPTPRGAADDGRRAATSVALRDEFSANHWIGRENGTSN